MKFTANVGTLDRILRIGAGIVLIALALTGTFSPWGWIGIVPLVTGFIRFCPFHSLIGLKTCGDTGQETAA